MAVTRERVAQPRRSRRDFLFWGLVVGVVALSVALVVPLVQSGRLLYAHHGFVRDLSASAAYGRQHRSTTVEVDGETRDASYDQVSRLVETIVALGMGKPSDAVPDGPGVTVSFGDGSALELFAVGIAEAGRSSDEGVLVRFTRADGAVFSYDTDRLSYADVLRILA